LYYSNFRQMVRRFRPSMLIPALAAHSAERYSISSVDKDYTKGGSPWAVSAMARESLIYSNEFRSNEAPTRRDIDRLYNAFNETSDLRGDDGIAQIVTPIAYEQFGYQESTFEELSRTAALLNDPTLGPEIAWSDILGMPLGEAVRAAFILRFLTEKNGGRYEPAHFDEPYMTDVFEKAAPKEQLETMAKALTVTVEGARELNRNVPAVGKRLQRHAFNPLVARPLIDLGERGIWAPQPMLISASMFPNSLYYRGIQMWGSSFARTLGSINEQYVGKQLRLLAKDSLLPEIEFKPGHLTVDWIWITDAAVVLVECKSARLTLGAKAGDDSLSENVTRSVGKGRAQIDTTARLIRAKHPALSHVPSDRPILGMVVTAEPFYLANSGIPEYHFQSLTPSLVVSLRELETWVCLSPTRAVDFLSEVLADPEKRTWAMSSAMSTDERVRRNPILDDAWSQYSFLSETDHGPHAVGD